MSADQYRISSSGYRGDSGLRDVLPRNIGSAAVAWLKLDQLNIAYRRNIPVTKQLHIVSKAILDLGRFSGIEGHVTVAVTARKRIQYEAHTADLRVG
jgi:hypothetical protein